MNGHHREFLCSGDNTRDAIASGSQQIFHQEGAWQSTYLHKIRGLRIMSIGKCNNFRCIQCSIRSCYQNIDRTMTSTISKRLERKQTWNLTPEPVLSSLKALTQNVTACNGPRRDLRVRDPPKLDRGFLGHRAKYNHSAKEHSGAPPKRKRTSPVENSLI